MSAPGREPIAIIGSSCRFPGGSDSPSKLWKLVEKPRDLLTEIPADRFNAGGFYHPNGLHHGTSNVRHAYFLSQDHRHFDARFFGIKDVEANAIDPQQRILLETVYEGVDAAGLKLENLRGSDTAVYVGLMCGDYETMLLRDLDTVPTYHATGIARSIMANRISYFFDWHGPSMTIDTACSSSLVAVHQAVQSLRSGESKMAVAAGSNLILGPENYIAESKLKMLSPTGRSRMWDKDADGYARGEGVAAVVLKTLSAAVMDGDHIECLIRETGVNQDGRTRGITMPSAIAQTFLIRDTYARAGLDPYKASDRCQYFEAHGTGTPTGDPLEAEAINAAFFRIEKSTRSHRDGVLHVGSIKTVIGHTEGTAGLAGILKASLALQHGVIPPNMLLNELNPSIRPFYENLQIASNSKPWPLLPAGQPRRASVNSFGFGGTNGHVILESYGQDKTLKSLDPTACHAPLIFSANSRASLVAQLGAYAGYLSENPSISLTNLAFSLSSRKTSLPIKAAFAAQTVDDLRSRIQNALSEDKGNDEAAFGVRSSNPPSPAILGVFTGQGAQYARMGAELLLSSGSARKCFENLQQSLDTLPFSDRPQWTLKEELLAEASSSRVTEAALSQPLCTAIQVMLVDILQEAGVHFMAVVGHSSGEIGAAYAAGYLTAETAIRIAYYRGLHSHLAFGKNGIKGAMMAVATSNEDAEELCELSEFKGRLNVAAINSAASVTLSGDEDAIMEAKTIFDDEKKKAKILNVDKAYHSPHMVQCSSAYLHSLQTCSIEFEARAPGNSAWISSVCCREMTNASSELKSSYWIENLNLPVLFAPALKTALEQGPSFDAVIEIGPHPALKGPVSMSIQDVLSKDIPYTGLLSRNMNAIDALADGLGYLWTRLGDHAVNLASYARFMAGGAYGRMLKDLPTYQWDHDRPYWQESRLSRIMRGRNVATNELLGTKCPDDTTAHISWRNLLRIKEMPWIQGHAIQGQTVFPAAGYVATAVEAAMQISPLGHPGLIEIEDFIIHQPMVFNEEDLGIEILFSFSNIAPETDDTMTANFTYHSAAGKDSKAMMLMADGRLRILNGTLSNAELPPRPPLEPNMVQVEADRFYSFLAGMGYGYTGPFRALSSLQRKREKASGLLANFKHDGETAPLLIHPAMLDAAIQAVILAFCYPNDGQLWSMYLPTSIRRIRIIPQLSASISGHDFQLTFDSRIDYSTRSEICGDVSLYTPSDEHAMLQLEGMKAVPFTEATIDNDANIFSAMQWGPAGISGEAAVGSSRASPDEYKLAYTLERVSSFYLRSLDREIPQNHLARKQGSYVGYFNYAAHIGSQVAEGTHPYAKKEWLADTLDDILSMSKLFPDSPDLNIMHVVGREMPRVIRGETTILEHLLPNNLLNDYYSNALGFPEFTIWLSRMTAQLSHRYPRMNILEIGAGTGGATRGILKHIDHWYSSYTFTDISNGFFESAQEVFKDHADKMTYKVLDIEKDTAAQGFEEFSYDLIIASFVLHATSKLEHTLRNVRRLLKPGGHLLMAEVTNNDQIRGGFIFGALPGWWLGADDGRIFSPCVSPVQWDVILSKTGFSGVDTMTPDLDRFPYPGSIIASQAVDPQVNYLRRPLSAPYSRDLGRRVPDKLLVLGGATLKTRALSEEVSEILLNLFPWISQVATVEEISANDLSSSTAVLSLAELDEPVFKNLTPEKFQGLKSLFSQERMTMWITEGRRADNPESNMLYGFARSQQWEVPGLHLQFIDLESPLNDGARTIAESFARFWQLVTWNKAGKLENILWSLEPEMMLKNGEIFIPRLAPFDDANERINSSKRQISKQLPAQGSSLRLIDQQGSRTLEEAEQLRPLSSLDAEVDIDVEYSLLPLVKMLAGRGYVAAGTIAGTETKVLAITGSQASKVRVPRPQVVYCSSTRYEESTLLLVFVFHLVAEYLLSKAHSGDTILVYEPGPIMSHVLQQHATEKAVQVQHISSKPGHEKTWTFIHSYATENQIRNMIAENTSLFVNLATDGQAMNVGARIASLLPRSCGVESHRCIFTEELRTLPYAFAASVQSSLQVAMRKTIQVLNSDKIEPHATVVDIADFGSHHKIIDPLSQVKWKSKSTVAVNIQPVDSKYLFRPDRTYWLVGLSGGLGLSLCEWMVQHGAKYLVISSRNPKVEESWAENIKNIGAIVNIYSCDITSSDSIRKLHSKICQTLPPIAGVAQGAMVLQDTPTRDMSFPNISSVLQPKVDGSKYLDELFQEKTLDFFVFFSSMTGVIGNMGQSNYTAANTFMCALARQRRNKGLAASVINIGVIIGVGYVTREVSHADQKNLRKGGYMWMSERDFHQIFAEAVIAGQPDSGIDPELSTGLRRIDPDDPYQPIWYNNPIFSKCILQKVTATAHETSNSSGPSIKVRLETAKNETQIASIIQDCFVVQLRILLGIAADDGSARQTMPDSRTDELGIDSLIAVEIRSWFLKNLNVNVPVLKILSGVTIRDLTQFAVKELPRDLVPRLTEEDYATAPPETSVVQPEEASLKYASTQPDVVHQVFSSSNTSSLELRSGSVSSHIPSSNTPASIISEDEWTDGTKSALANVSSQRELPMSFSQSMFWFVTAMLQDKTTLNHFGFSRVHGNLRVNDLMRAVEVVAQRHEALRTRFFVDEKQQTKQGVLETSLLHLEHRWVADKAELQKECDLLEKHTYDLENGETMKIVLLSKTTNEQYLLIGCHHINLDGISHQVLMSDLAKAYSGETLDASILQFPDYSTRQLDTYHNGGWKSELAYWKQELAGFATVLPILSLSTAILRRPLHEYIIHRVDSRINPALASRIKETCRRLRLTPFNFYLSAFKVLLLRFSNVEDLCIGIGDGNRVENDTLGSIGPFVNLLPLRFRRKKSETFQEVLQEARNKTYDALSNSAVPFEVLLNELNAPRSACHSPLFQAFIDYRQGARERMQFGDCELEMIEFKAGRTAYDLSLDIVDDTAGQPLLMMMAQASLYSESDAKVLAQSYVNLVETFAEDPELAIEDAPLHNAFEIQTALELGRGPIHELTWPKTLSHRINEMIKISSQKTSIRDINGRDMTYETMSIRCDNIASAMLDAGMVQGSVVAVLQEPGLDWICSLLAILKIGCLYLPLDLGTPIKRLAMMARNAYPAAILVHEATKNLSMGLNTGQVAIIDVSQDLHSSKADIPVLAKADDPAVIIYTSGSTGVPKGIVLKHSSFVNEAELSAKIYGLGPNDVILQQSALSFDMSVLQILLALAVGGTLCLTPRSSRGDPIAITELILREKVTFTCATPSEYTGWLTYGKSEAMKRSSWKAALSGGEPLSKRLLQMFRSLRKPDLHLFNGYGPAETTCCSTKVEIDYNDITTHEEGISAGFASPNESIYILDDNLQSVPIGVPGEIVIGGAGVGIGYLADQQLSKKHFVSDHFATTGQAEKGWITMYRTGDRGRLRRDGSLKIEGRLVGDTQIKLRGLRIELREVEEAILHASMGILVDCVVSTRTDSTDSSEFLVAHVVFTADYPLSKRQPFLNHLPSTLSLPQYMCPAVVTSLERLPMNSSGKIDRRCVADLPILKTPQMKSYSTTRTTLMPLLQEIWGEVIPSFVFSSYAIGPESDFFYVGGNSMLLVRLQALIKQNFDVSLPLTKLFEISTLRGMALFLEDQSETLNCGFIDWMTETKPEVSSSTVRFVRDAQQTAASPKVVVLTGATGFLGTYLLNVLTKNSQVQKIHCIAVRNAQTREMLLHNPKVNIHMGDLTKPMLGLSAETAREIFAEADVVIHNAADVSHLKTYYTLRPANVWSTKELVRLSLDRSIPIHYVSTAGVAMLTPRKIFTEVSVADTYPPTDGSDGYNASKWASERYLERTSEETGLPVWIHRPSSITHPSRLLGEDASEMEFLPNLFKYSRLLKAVPSSDKVQGEIDLVSAENVAKGIVASALGGNQPSGSQRITHIHQTGDFCLPISGIKAFLESETKETFETINISEWADRAIGLGLHPTVAVAFKHVEERQSAMVFPAFVKGKRD